MLPGSKRKQLEVIIVPEDFVIEVVRTTSAVFVRHGLLGGQVLSVCVCAGLGFSISVCVRHIAISVLLSTALSLKFTRKERQHCNCCSLCNRDNRSYIDESRLAEVARFCRERNYGVISNT